MLARIYRPTKTAMQSGRANTKEWVLEFEQAGPREVEPLMGWTASSDMNQQVRLEFDTKDQAIAYAARAGIPIQLTEPKERRSKPKSYSDNFRFDRKQPWSH
jgi:hypothetical protein